MKRPRIRSLLIPFGALIAAAPFLVSCELATQFKGPGYSRSAGVTLPDRGETVWVGLTNARLDGSKRAAFDDYTQRVLRDLPEREGLVGYSVRTRVFGNEVWTMTVWKDEVSLNAFVRAPVHREAMRNGMEGVTAAKFDRFEMAVSDVPPSWGDVKRRLERVTEKQYGGSR